MTKPITDTMTPSEMPTMDDPEAFAVAFVQAAVDLYKSDGAEAAITYYNNPASIEGQWYVFIVDTDGLFVSHAPRQDLVGTPLQDVRSRDGSYALGEEIAKATATGHWIEYVWPNPASGEDEDKRTWAIRHDGYLFGSGYYEPVAENSMPTMEDSGLTAENSTPEAN